jgi:hypothetical protein
VLKLFRKELILFKKPLVIYLLFVTGWTIWISYQVPRAGVLAVFTTILVTLIPITIIAREDRFKGAAVTCSLPFRRKTIVQSRYLLSWILMGVGMVYTFTLVMTVPVSRVNPAELMTAKTVFLSLFLLTVFFAALFPFVIRFGLMGLLLFLIGTQMAGVVLFLVVAMTSTRLNLRGLFSWIAAGIGALMSHLGAAGFYPFLILVMVSINIISLKCSERLFAAKEL